MENKNYQFCQVSKKGENSYNVTLKAWVVDTEKSHPTTTTAMINGVEKDVMNFLVSAKVGKSKMKFMGMEEKETMFLNCSAIAERREGIVSVVDRLKKLELRKGYMLLLVGTVTTKTSEDGKTYHTFYVDNFDVEVRPKKNVDTNDADVHPEENGDMPF